MKISVTTHHELKFAVEAFWDEEGGMGTEKFGKDVATLEEAVTLIQAARANRSDTNWIITVEVTTKSSKA